MSTKTFDKQTSTTASYTILQGKLTITTIKRNLREPHRKFIFSHIVAAFSMLSSWLGVNKKAPLVRKSVSLISESVSWSCQSPESRRPSWFNRDRELFFDADMSFSHVALPSCPLWDIFYRASKVGSAGSRSNVTRYARSTPCETRSRRTVKQLRIDTLLLYRAQALWLLIVDRSAHDLAAILDWARPKKGVVKRRRMKSDGWSRRFSFEDANLIKSNAKSKRGGMFRGGDGGRLTGCLKVEQPE